MNFLALADLKLHLAVTTNDDDALLLDQIEAAKANLAKFIGIDLDATYWDGSSANPDNLPKLPADLHEALKQLASHLFEHRELALIGTSASIIPHSLFDLVGPYRIYNF
jgi:hypothetical protein